MRFHGQAYFRTGSDDHRFRFAAGRFGQHIRALADIGDLRRIAFLERQILAAEYQAARTILALYCSHPGHYGLDRVARTPYFHVRYIAQRRGLFDRLVRRTVFPQTDGVMGIHEQHAYFHQCRHAQCIARIFREHQKGAAERQQAAMQCHAVHDRGHAEFTHAVADVIARLGAVYMMRSGPVGQVGAGQVGRTAEKLG